MIITLVATCAFGIESVLAEEITRLGFGPVRTNNGYVEYETPLEGICKSNLWLRTAERVFIKAGSFRTETFEDLFQGVRKIQWEKYLASDSIIHVNGKSVNSKLFSVPDCQSISKKAIVECMKEKTGLDWLPETGYKIPVMISILKDETTVLLDTSGEGLHKRGYRAKGNEAPLKETMAAAMVQIARWRPEDSLVDPFCGSGTILIEAAMIARNIAPGLNRKFISETWSWVSAELWKHARKDAYSAIRQDLNPKIMGSDMNPISIRTARENAIEAGVDDCIEFAVNRFGEWEFPSERGALICNPPYGERMGEQKEVQELYQQMGKYMKKYPGWSVYVLTAHEHFEKLYDNRSSKNRKVYNGRIRCYFYQFFGRRVERKESECAE